MKPDRPIGISILTFLYGIAALVFLVLALPAATAGTFRTIFMGFTGGSWPTLFFVVGVCILFVAVTGGLWFGHSIGWHAAVFLCTFSIARTVLLAGASMMSGNLITPVYSVGKLIIPLLVIFYLFFERVRSWCRVSEATAIGGVVAWTGLSFVMMAGFVFFGVLLS